MSINGLCSEGHILSKNPLKTGCWRCRYNNKRRTAYQLAKTYNIFVYGTLKRGCHNHRVIEGGTFVSEDALPGARIYGYTPVGGVPFVVLDKAAPGSVKGELYNVPHSVLLRLDRLEGHPHAYKRTPVTLASGQRAEVYVWQRPVGMMVELVGGEYRTANR